MVAVLCNFVFSSSGLFAWRYFVSLPGFRYFVFSRCVITPFSIFRVAFFVVWSFRVAFFFVFSLRHNVRQNLKRGEKKKTTDRVGSHEAFAWIHCTDVRIHCTDTLIECRKIFLCFLIYTQKVIHHFPAHIFPYQTLPG